MFLSFSIHLILVENMKAMMTTSKWLPKFYLGIKFESVKEFLDYSIQLKLMEKVVKRYNNISAFVRAPTLGAYFLSNVEVINKDAKFKTDCSSGIFSDDEESYFGGIVTVHDNFYINDDSKKVKFIIGDRTGKMKVCADPHNVCFRVDLLQSEEGDRVDLIGSIKDYDTMEAYCIANNDFRRRIDFEQTEADFKEREVYDWKRFMRLAKKTGLTFPKPEPAMNV